MIVTNIKTHRLTTPLRKPFRTALRSVDHMENVIVIVETDTDHIGIGGAAPSSAVTGATTESVEGAALFVGHAIKGMEVLHYEEILQSVHSCMVGNASAKAAIDMAIFDLVSKHYQAPLYEFLGGCRRQLITDYTIGIDSPEEMASESLQKVDQGFFTLKVKVGSDNCSDLERLRAIRQSVGKEIRIRIDANQGWGSKKAVRTINKLQSEGIDPELVEQPVKHYDIEGMKYVKDRVELPVIADESVFSPWDALQLVRRNAVDGINIKLMKCGGISQGLKLAAIAEIAGIECMMGCMVEGLVGITAAAHLAAARPVITHLDLDALLFCDENPVLGGIQYNGGQIILPETPGLGIDGISGIF